MLLVVVVGQVVNTKHGFEVYLFKVSGFQNSRISCLSIALITQFVSFEHLSHHIIKHIMIILHPLRHMD